MAIYQCDFTLVDVHGNENIKTISYEQLETIMKKEKSWSSDIIQYGDIDDTCVEVYYFNENIDSVFVRINVASVTPEEVNAIINFINDNNLYILYEENIISATKENLASIVRSSAAYRFLKDNKKFLDEIENI